MPVGEPTHEPAQRDQHAVGDDGTVLILNVVEQRRHLLAADVGERHVAERRQDVHLQLARDLIARAQPCDVPPQIVVGHLAQRRPGRRLRLHQLSGTKSAAIFRAAASDT